MAILKSKTALHWILFLLLGTVALPAKAGSWWDKKWTVRKAITVDTSSSGTSITEPIGKAVVLIRLHSGNYQFPAGKDDGSDIRFVAEDDKTLLPYHIERFDSVVYEAYVWVKLPDVKPSGQTKFWLYYGNPAADRAGDPKATYDEDTALVYHFTETNAPPVDATSNGNTAQNAGIPVGGSLISGGLRLSGQNGIRIPATPSLAWSEGGAFSWSVWIKPTAFRTNGVIFSSGEAGRTFLIGENEGVPFIEIDGQRSAAGAPLLLNTWRHLAVVAEGSKTSLYLDGQSYAALDAALPAVNSPATLGGDGSTANPESVGFSGEIDELQIAKVARPIGALQLAAANQGPTPAAEKLIVLGADEGGAGGSHSIALEHVMLFGDIARNMMFDGWIAVGVCLIMIAFGWTVGIRKFNYLNSIQQGSEVFLEQWAHTSSDLTVLDHGDEENIRNLGGNLDKRTLQNLHRSPIYHLYHIGSQEIRNRITRAPGSGLSARSIQAIRSSLESGLVRENQRMNKGLIFLTISIAGGPYVGLLGTVVGVMITFAIIAKNGEVDVNSIAPGIASALLATVAGLVVAIPALFIYTYLSSRIKELLASMQVFIDEFIAKMAEFYPTPADSVRVQTARENGVSGRPQETLLATKNHAG